MRPPRPSGKYKRTLARLCTLVGKTAGRPSTALERGEDLVALRKAPLVVQVAQTAKCSSTRWAR